MLDLDVAGLATISESGVSVERAPDGITFQRLDEDHERLYSLVGWDEKFAAHNAAVWQHGLLVVVPAGGRPHKPPHVRAAPPEEHGSRLLRPLAASESGGPPPPLPGATPPPPRPP